MTPKILFIVMSAVSKPGTVDQLARALAPHTVLVHHDFSQTPDFPISAPNARFVPDPKRTGWAVFGFVEGIFHSLRYAIDKLDFDYVQLLSPTCLPIKSMSQFEAHVSGREEAHFDCIDVLQDRDALMSVGYRAFTPASTLRHRIARRLSVAYFSNSPGRRDEAGIWLRTGGGSGIVPRVAVWTIEALKRPSIGHHIFDESFRPYYGSPWFGARRHLIAGMLEGFSRSGVRDYFSRLHMAEEYLIPSLLRHMNPVRGPLNHHIQKFVDAHPGEFGEQDLAQLKATPKYFARKFPDNALAPVRLQLLRELDRSEPVANHAASAPRPFLAYPPDVSRSLVPR